MIAIVSDGYYSGTRVSVVYRSLGGALGGCPPAPTIHPDRPSLEADDIRPEVSTARGVEGISPLSTGEPRPVVIISTIRPSLVPTDDDDC